jgi:hypothetical protein
MKLVFQKWLVLPLPFIQEIYNDLNEHHELIFIFDNKIDCAIFQFETDTLPRIELRHMIVNNLFDVHRKFRLFFLLIYNLIKIVCEVLYTPLFEGNSLCSVNCTLNFWDFTRPIFNNIVWWKYLIIIAPYNFFHIMW